MKMLYDIHMHTLHSDGKNTVDEMCRSAIEKGMTGIAITDHADMYCFEEKDTLASIGRLIEDVRVAREKYAGQLDVLCGVELGEYAMAPHKADSVLALDGLDVVLYSEHYVTKARWALPYSKIRFCEDGSDDEIRDYMKWYFEQINETVDLFDFDVLGHLTCPARYITGRHKRATDVMLSEKTVTEILKKIVDRDIALELNTCGRCCESFSYYDAQNEEILKLYYSLGGRKVTLGSDAHAVGGIGRGIAEATKQLAAMGFDGYYYYRNRQPVKIAFQKEG